MLWQFGLPGASVAIVVIALSLVVAGYGCLAREGRQPAWHHHLARPMAASAVMVPACLVLLRWHVLAAVVGGAMAYLARPGRDRRPEAVATWRSCFSGLNRPTVSRALARRRTIGPSTDLDPSRGVRRHGEPDESARISWRRGASASLATLALGAVAAGAAGTAAAPGRLEQPERRSRRRWS